jgi:hypothetical protein
MSLFTESEAKACIMTSCDFIENQWLVGVIGSDNLYYEVIIKDLDANASKSSIQNDAIKVLQTLEKKAKNPTIVSKQDSDDIGIGSSLG